MNFCRFVHGFFSIAIVGRPITFKKGSSKKKQRTDTKKDARGLRVITLQGTIEQKSNIAWGKKWLDGNKIISYFGASNKIIADCTS